MNRGDDSESMIDPTPASWLKFGQRNILYLGFVVLLLPLGMALDGPKTPGVPMGTQSLGGLPFALTLCDDVSIGFFLLNAALAIVGFVKGQWIRKALIGCALPAMVGMGAMLAR